MYSSSGDGLWLLGIGLLSVDCVSDLAAVILTFDDGFFDAGGGSASLFFFERCSECAPAGLASDGCMIVIKRIGLSISCIILYPVYLFSTCSTVLLRRSTPLPLAARYLALVAAAAAAARLHVD